MKKGAGHVDGTSAWNGNVSLCGHNRGSWPYFGNLKYVQVGDVVTYKTSLGIRTYRVTFAGRILATDTDVLNPTAGDQITMLTCIANEPAYRFYVIGQEMR
ncbi:sortase [Intestinibacillus sp. NTUH-41-i26]|uniref:sortase n=1 Tax=Butyricicoccaceae TaxID=3085642 RepID=UPI001FA8BB8D|nr:MULTISPECIES: sortase [Butyricicoccaceae]WOC76001.1 sortase [Intestinibacillus sp. NTUH-41-i26]